MSYEKEIRGDGPFVSSLHLLFDEALPGEEEVSRRLGARHSIATDPGFNPEEDVSRAADIAWHRALRIGDYPFPFLVYAQRGMPDEEPRLFDEERRWWEPERVERLERVQGHLTVETILAPDNAQAAFGFQCQIAALAGGANVLAAWDAQAHRLRRPMELYDITSSGAPPSVRELFGLFAYPCDDPEGSLGAEPRYGLASRGLERCLSPNLQIVAARREQLELAEELIAAVAGQWIVAPVPPPGEEFGLMGVGSELVWRKAHEFPHGVAAQGAAPHAGVLLPAARMAGSTEPFVAADLPRLARAADAMLDESGGGPLQSVSGFESRIQEAQARERVGSLKQLWQIAEESGADAEFSMKVGFSIDPPDPDADAEGAPAPGGVKAPRKEHLWFRLRDVQEDGFSGELLSSPIMVEGIDEGDIRWFTKEEITDWRARVGQWSLDPRRMLAVRGALRVLGKGAGK